MFVYSYFLTSLLTYLCINTEPAIYFSSCLESVGRKCSFTNHTDYLLDLKKGGSDILSTSLYLYDFYVCEEYNYDCGYMETDTSYVTIANGINLNITLAQLDTITNLQTTYNKIKPYVGENGDYAMCGIKLFPLVLTPTQSIEVIDGDMKRVDSLVLSSYESRRNKSSTISWPSININIRTALLNTFQKNISFISETNPIWSSLLSNSFTEISKELKTEYEETSEQIKLHNAYLIDSVTSECNKLQSVNFLVDESGSIGTAEFQLALKFLGMYVNDTKDEISLMSIHFYDWEFDSYLDYGKNKTYFQTMIPIKSYRAAGTRTGQAMNASIDKILSAGMGEGLPKVLVVLTDGASYDSVRESAKRAADNGIICLSVGIGEDVNSSQLLEIAGNPSNVILIESYDDLPKLVEFIANYFCKQIITIRINEVIDGNLVRVPESPSYFRVEKSNSVLGQTYLFTIYFEENPSGKNFSAFESEMDPFPDKYTELTKAEYYDVFTEESLKKSIELSSSFIPRRVYFIKPEHEVEYIVKKNQKDVMDVIVSYVSIGGNDLKFNLSVTGCTTLNCDEERALYATISPPKPVNPDVFMTPSEDLSIFIAIGVALALLACLCGLCLLGVRKFGEEEEEEKKKLNDVPNIATQENISEGLMPAETGNKVDANGNIAVEILNQGPSRIV